MQATYSVRRSPLTLFIALTILVGALVLGGLAGYALRGAFTASTLAPATQTSIQDSTAPAGEGLYVQGGRPPVVYATP